MNHQDIYRLLQTVQKNVRCPQCGKEYDFSAVEIRGIVDAIVFLEMNCSDHMPLLATVAFNKTESPEKNTQREKVSSDDVLLTHETLNAFSGTFEQIFNSNLK